MSENKLFIAILITALTPLVIPETLFYILSIVSLICATWELYHYYQSHQLKNDPYPLFVVGVLLLVVALFIPMLYQPLLLIGVFLLIRTAIVVFTNTRKQNSSNPNYTVKKEDVEEEKNLYAVENFPRRSIVQEEPREYKTNVDKEAIRTFSYELDRKTDSILSTLQALERKLDSSSPEFGIQQNNWNMFEEGILQAVRDEVSVLANVPATDSNIDEKLNTLNKEVEQLSTVINQSSLAEKEFITSMIENTMKQNKEDATKDMEEIIHHVIEKFQHDRISFAKVRHIRDAQIREKFLEALQTAEHELCIISPWLGTWIFKNEFLSLIQGACNRGVTVKILYGIEDPSKGTGKNNRSIKTEELADSLRKKLAKFEKRGTFKIKLTNTHFKLVICDDSFYMIGSYNFLSFEGRYDEHTRGEGIDYSENKEMIKEYKERYFDF